MPSTCVAFTSTPRVKHRPDRRAIALFRGVGQCRAFRCRRRAGRGHHQERKSAVSVLFLASVMCASRYTELHSDGVEEIVDLAVAVAE